MADEEKQEAKSDPLEEIRERYEKASTYWAEDRKQALDDLKFMSGKQWPDDVVALREKQKRPCLTVDKLSQYSRQIVNDGRQNRPSIKVRPVDSGADIETAEVFQGVIRHIEDRSNADTAYDTSLHHSSGCGQGYLTVSSEYANDATTDQELCIKRKRNPLSILIDPSTQEADGCDMKYAFEVEQKDREEYEEKYPGKSTESLDDNSGWFGDEIRVCRYWEVREEDRKVYILTNGDTLEQIEYDALVKVSPSIAKMVKEERNIPKRSVWHALVNGKEYLEEPKQWPGKYIPIIPVWGNELDIEGKVMHSGIYRAAKDAQRLYNYSRSAFAERVALTPKSPWVAAEGQVEQYEDEWKTANTENHSVLRYTPVSLDGSPVPAPQRQQAADIPAGFAQDMQMSEHDIQSAVGMYNASLGAPSNEKSGKAIMARQREGDTGTFHYHDNLNRAIRHIGRILVDLIPKIYDSTRVVRILGFDGKADQVQLDPTQPKASQKQGTKTIYNLGVGTYDVAISAGPSYTTLRSEAAESMMQLVQAQPSLMGVIGDLLVANMDWPGADDIAKRLKLMLPQQIQQAEQKPELPDEVRQALAQFDAAVKQKDQMIEQAASHIESLMAQIASLKESHDIKEDETKIKAIETEISAYKAETDRLKVIQPAILPDQIKQIVLQTMQDLQTGNAQQFPQPEEAAEDAGAMPAPEQQPAPAMQPQPGMM